MARYQKADGGEDAMSWKDILKTRFEHDSAGVAGASNLEESNVWEDMENPHEMKDFLTKDQIGDGIQFHLKDETYVGVDKFITDLKRVTGQNKFNRGRYGVANTMAGIVARIAEQEGNLEERKAIWELMQRHYKDNARTFEETWGEGWTTDEKNIPSWKKEKMQ